MPIDQEDKKWYQQFRCRNCGEKFSQFPSLLGCVRSHGVNLLRLDHPYVRGMDEPQEVKNSNAWVRTHTLHPCNKTENGIADLIGFTMVTPQVPEGGLYELTGDEIPAHLR